MTAPCYYCLWHERDCHHGFLLCVLHKQPNKDGTCESFEHLDPIVENQRKEEMDKIRGKGEI